MRLIPVDEADRGELDAGAVSACVVCNKSLAISEFPKWSKYLILLSFQDNSSARICTDRRLDVNICHSRVDCSPRTPAVQCAIPSPGAILSHTDGPCGS